MNKEYAKVQSTRKSLILSVLSLMLCVAMLIGTTYAWFTDSVTSGRNKIIAGNLDVELYHTNKTVTKEAVKSDTELFKDVKLWEPGAVAYETLTVANVGTLALNYQMSVLVDNEVKVDDHGLSEVLKVGTFNGTVAAGMTREELVDAVSVSDWQSIKSFTKNGSLDAETEDDPVTYVIYWEPSDNDNLYNMNNEKQGKVLSIDLGVKLVAGQRAKEIDSFDEKYDLSAFIQVNPANVKDVLANLKDGDNLYLAAGVYTPSVTNMFRIEKNDVTIVGAGKDTVLNCTEDLSSMAGVLICGDNVTLANLTVKTASTNGNVAAVRFSDMTADAAIVNGGKLENITVIGSKGHGINVQGATDVIIDKVDVQSYSKCGISFGNASATVTNTKIAAGGWGADIGCMYAANDAYINPCDITIGEGNDFGNGKIYSERPASANEGKDVITFADPSDWVKTDNDNGWTAVAAVAKIGDTGYATLQDAIDAAEENQTVTLASDIVAAMPNNNGYANHPVFTISKNITLDGNDKTISVDANNWQLYNSGITGNIFCIGVQDTEADRDVTVTVKDLTIAGNKNLMKHGISAYACRENKTELTLENVTIKDCGANGVSINGADVKVDDVTISNCGWGPYDNTNGSLTFMLDSADDLFDFASYVNAGHPYVNGVLTADIDLENKEWTPIGTSNDVAGDWRSGNYFAGSFDGQNHTISNLKVVGTAGQNNLGLFGQICVAEGVEIKNVVIDGATVTGSGQSTGVLAGAMNVSGHWQDGVGLIADSCKNITVKNAVVTGGKYTGGVIGYAQTNFDTITVENTKVSSVKNDLADDSGENAGLLCGDLYHLFNASNITINNGEVFGFSKVGGVAGSAQHADYIKNVTVNGLKVKLDSNSTSDYYGSISGRTANVNMSKYTGISVTGDEFTKNGVTITAKQCKTV